MENTYNLCKKFCKVYEETKGFDGVESVDNELVKHYIQRSNILEVMTKIAGLSNYCNDIDGDPDMSVVASELNEVMKPIQGWLNLIYPVPEGAKLVWE